MSHPGDPFIKSSMREFGPTVFAQMSALAEATGAINLGQGFPDTDGPAKVAEAAIEAIRHGHNQYPPGAGIAPLRAAIAKHQHKFYDLSFDPESEVLVTAGATEAIAASLLALCEPGDEVVTFEPYYDSYAASIAMANASRSVVTLRAPDYRFDPNELRAAIGPKTKAILVNSPHNPTGKVFDHDELALIAELCCEHDLVAICDEVYEHLVYEGSHRPLIAYPNMRNRTIQISSAGKTYSFTGWKIGWVCAQPALVAAVATVKQFLTFVNGAPFQPAIALALGLPRSFYNDLLADFAMKRVRLCTGLEQAGFGVIRPAGTYFVTADVAPLGFDDGMEFCLGLPARCGVVAIPNAVFYDNVAEGRSMVRFAFCKQLSVIDEAVERLSGM